MMGSQLRKPASTIITVKNFELIKRSIKYVVLLFGMVFLCSAATANEQIFEDLTLEKLEILIEKHAPQDIAELLSLLPEGFRSSYTLVHSSRSLQGSSKENPRVIVFGRTARFVLTFNGEPSQSGYNVIEMYQFRDDERQFEFFKLSFEDGVARLSDRNPRQCLACHGETPQPIWDSYPDWPGVYGGDDDYLRDEQAAFDRFVVRQESHPRYKHLVRRSDIIDIWPYRTRNSLHVNRANNRFGRLLGGLGAQNAAQQILSSSFYVNFPNTTMLHVLGCKIGQDDEQVAKVKALFEARFSEDQFPILYANLNTITKVELKVIYMLERLIVNSERGGWNLNAGFKAKGERYSPDGRGALSSNTTIIEDHAATRIFGALAQVDPELQAHFEPWTAHENHAWQNPFASRLNLAKYGIGDAYNEVNVYMDIAKSKKACSVLLSRSRQEQ